MLPGSHLHPSCRTSPFRIACFRATSSTFRPASTCFGAAKHLRLQLSALRHTPSLSRIQSHIWLCADCELQITLLSIVHAESACAKKPHGLPHYDQYLPICHGEALPLPHPQYSTERFLCKGWNNFGALVSFINEEVHNGDRYRDLTSLLAMSNR